MKTGRIQEGQLVTLACQHTPDGVAGRLRFVGCNGQGTPGQFIQQGRFADIGPPRDCHKAAGDFFQAVHEAVLQGIHFALFFFRVVAIAQQMKQAVNDQKSELVLERVPIFLGLRRDFGRRDDQVAQEEGPPPLASIHVLPGFDRA